MAVINKRPSPRQEASAKLRQRARRREVQRLPAGRHQAQAQNPTIQSDVYPNAGTPDAAQLQASATKLPNLVYAPHLRHASFIPPTSLRGRRSTAGVSRLIQGQETRHDDALRNKERTAGMRAIGRQVVPRHLTQMKAAQTRSPGTQAMPQELAQQRIAYLQRQATQRHVDQTHASQNLVTEDEMEESNEQETDPSKLYSGQYKTVFISKTRPRISRSANDSAAWIITGTPPGIDPLLIGPLPPSQMHASGRVTDRMRRYQAAQKSLQLEPQKQRAKEFSSVVPTISKDHTAGEQALQADLLAKLGRGKERLLSTRHTGREQPGLNSPARNKFRRDK